MFAEDDSNRQADMSQLRPYDSVPELTSTNLVKESPCPNDTLREVESASRRQPDD
jgi:hypothetical protein